MLIKIVRRPIGEAPDWVRDAWIGLSLPVAIPSHGVQRGFGVLSMPSSRIGQLWAIMRGKSIKTEGYLVYARLAVEMLALTKPEAAKWWRDNTPELLSGPELFLFDQPCAEILG